MNRLSWDEYFVRITEIISKRSTCIRRRCGAIIVRGKRLLASGYNGAPSGLKHCADTGCLRKQLSIPSGERHEVCRALHAEMNAIIQASISGVNIKNSSIYTTNFPCSICARMIIGSKIKTIYCWHNYPDTYSMKLLNEANITIVKLPYEKKEE